MGLLLLAAAGLESASRCEAALGRTKLALVEGPPSAANPLYITNREPLLPLRFVKLPIGSITPKGWVRHQLELEAAGMTGHLEEISKWCKFEGNAWVSADGKGENPWEEVPYWLKGYGDLGYVLKDDKAAFMFKSFLFYLFWLNCSLAIFTLISKWVCHISGSVTS